MFISKIYSSTYPELLEFEGEKSLNVILFYLKGICMTNMTFK